MFFLIFLSCIWSYTLTAESFSPKSNLKTSVIVPCLHKHAKFLCHLIQEYQNQTVKPDEIIISISEFNKVDPQVISQLYSAKWIFPVNIITTDEVEYAGENRNIACSRATGDILILQDADDLPHPQRVEIIKYFFENFDIDHLMHEYEVIAKNKYSYKFDSINAFRKIKYYLNQKFDFISKTSKFTHGNIAISKKLFTKKQWGDSRQAQDFRFNKFIYNSNEYGNKIVIQCKLLLYRKYLSSRNLGSLWL